MSTLLLKRADIVYLLPFTVQCPLVVIEMRAGPLKWPLFFVLMYTLMYTLTFVLMYTLNVWEQDKRCCAPLQAKLLA